jgi:2-hydroxy-4-carboxymuconate semialdehyde hemiacetal dehydrogenase
MEPRMNICVVGYGMMGQWHSEALRKVNIGLHTAVGRRPEGAKEFARRYGYRRRVLSLDEALADPAIDIVILATPSELHEEQAIKSLRAGKHTLVEIPMAMSLRGGGERGCCCWRAERKVLRCKSSDALASRARKSASAQTSWR